MSKNLKLSLALAAAAVLVVIVVASLGGDDEGEATPAATQLDRVVRPDSQRLSTAADGRVTFTEFLDFECESCKAAHPAIEQLRATYDGRVTFVVRNFPLHVNSESAARAAEAAAAQGRYEDMYDLLFETQPQWGEKRSSQEDVFFEFAEQLGLDIARFRADYDDPAVLERIRRDKADGQELGVTGTPTFFLNDELLDVNSYEELIQRIDDALAA